MATVTVGTWSALATALAGASDGDIIQLTNSINCNNDIPDGAAAISMPDETYEVTLTGAHAPTFVTNTYYKKDNWS